MGRVRRSVLAAVVTAVAAYFIDRSRGGTARAWASSQLSPLLARMGRGGRTESGTSAPTPAPASPAAPAPAAAGTTAAGTTAPAAPSTAPPAPADDAGIADAVRHRFAASSVDTSQVTVESTGGVVALRGQVRSLGDQGILEVEASQVPGVREVKSWLHEPATTPPDEAATVEPEDAAPVDPAT